MSEGARDEIMVGASSGTSCSDQSSSASVVPDDDDPGAKSCIVGCGPSVLSTKLSMVDVVRTAFSAFFWRFSS